MNYGSLVCFVALLACESVSATGIAVLQFFVQPDAPAGYFSFANTFSDSLAEISGMSTAYLDSVQAGRIGQGDTAARPPDVVAIGTKSGAFRVVTGSLVLSNGRPRCSLELYDAADGKVCFSYSFYKPDSLGWSRFAVDLAQRVALFCPISDQVRDMLIEKMDVGAVYIRTNPSLANIYIDSAYSGQSPKVVENIFSGPHKLYLRHENEQLGQEFTVRPHRMENIAVVFPSAATGKSDSPSGLVNTLRIISLAGACIGGSASIYYYNFCKPQNKAYGLETGCFAAACIAGFLVTFMF
jgi:hypothetical protein